MKRNLNKVFILLFTILLFTCSGGKKQVYLYNIKNYYTVYEKEYDLYKIIKKNLLRKYLNLKEIKVNTFSALSNELISIDKYEKEGFIFLEDKLSSFLIKSGEIQFDKDKFKLITYNIPEEDIFYQSKIPTYNVLIDPEIVSKQIFQILKKHAVDKKNYSDCGIIINPDYYYSKNTLNYISKIKIAPDVIQIQGNDKRLEDWLYLKKRKAIVFFGYNANEILLNLNKTRLEKPVIIEVMTGYYKSADLVTYNIGINWDNAFLYAMNSSSFNKFLNDKLDFKDKGIYTNKVRNWFLVKTVKNRLKVKAPEFFPLEPEEEKKEQIKD